MRKIIYNLFLEPFYELEFEEWRDVDGYAGLYQVSDYGRVRSLITGRILKPGIIKGGYLSVGLYKNGTRKPHLVHRLVATAFCDKPEGIDTEVNHLDEEKTNNNYLNLEWISHLDNIRHGTCINRRAESNSVKINQLDLEGNLVKTWNSSREANILGGFSQGAINACCRNKFHKPGNNKYKGFIWKYADPYYTPRIYKSRKVS